MISVPMYGYWYIFWSPTLRYIGYFAGSPEYFFLLQKEVPDAVYICDYESMFRSNDGAAICDAMGLSVPSEGDIRFQYVMKMSVEKIS